MPRLGLYVPEYLRIADGKAALWGGFVIGRIRIIDFSKISARNFSQEIYLYRGSQKEGTPPLANPPYGNHFLRFRSPIKAHKS